jgi:hypothetical protein
MKTLIISILMLVSAATLAKGPKAERTVRVLSNRMHLLHLKLELDPAGTTLEIYTEKGELVKAEVITERRLLIDFSGLAEGIYKIKIRSGAYEVVMPYINNDTFAAGTTEEPQDVIILQGI